MKKFETNPSHAPQTPGGANDVKKIFFKHGPCSSAFFHLVNRRYAGPLKEIERAVDPLHGGIWRMGYQCGMIWGACLAAGAESFRRKGASGEATAMAVGASRRICNSFLQRANTLECSNVTSVPDMTKGLGVAKYMLSGKFMVCFDLAEKWGNEAIEAAEEGLSEKQTHALEPLSCASIAARKMGATNEEAAMVAGFAGGVGLSGNGCGALGAVVFMSALLAQKKRAGKPLPAVPDKEDILTRFYNESKFQVLCTEITGRKFESVDDHTKYIQGGGCAGLIEALTEF